MKVVFLETVANVARVGEIKDVADGYARNYLIPRKLALLATPDVLNRLGERLAAKSRNEAQIEAELKDMAEQLDGIEVIIEAQTGGKDRLYGSITTTDIASALEKATGQVVDKRKIEIDESIRQVGSYEAIIRLGRDIVPKIIVTIVEAEKAV